MERRYLRNIPAISQAEQAILVGKTVAVIGCGGLGGHLIELLCRMGIGAIRVVDGDVFEESNLNRQLLSTMGTLGTSKAQAAAERIRTISPETAVTVYPVFLDENNAAGIVGGCDAVLDALDSPQARRILAKACEVAQIPYIFGAISGWVAQAAVSMPGDRLMEKLFPEDTVLGDRSVLSFTPALCAALQASLCLKFLLGRPAEHGKILYADLLDLEFEYIPVV